MKYDKLTDGDRTTIATQLGREARGVLGVNLRCKYGYPQVITNRPVTLAIEEVHVFPTLFWLTCPYLKRKVSHLESEGKIAQFEQRVDNDPEFAASVQQDHKNHAQIRLSLIPSEVQASLQENYEERFKVIEKSGVGGSRNPEGIKCLHMHLADYLARGENRIGEEVLTYLTGPLHCSSGNCTEEL